MSLYPIVLFFLIVWSSIAGLVKIGDYAVENLADREDHNILLQGNVIEVDDVNFGGNPVQAGIQLFSWVGRTAATLAKLATFDAPSIWVGDLAMVRWILLASLGGAFVIAMGWETAKLLRG